MSASASASLCRSNSVTATAISTTIATSRIAIAVRTSAVARLTGRRCARRATSNPAAMFAALSKIPTAALRTMWLVWLNVSLVVDPTFARLTAADPIARWCEQIARSLQSHRTRIRRSSTADASRSRYRATIPAHRRQALSPQARRRASQAAQVDGVQSSTVSAAVGRSRSCAQRTS